MLPLLLAANPVNWGKPGKLSTVEALAASLVLMNQKEQARELLSKFRWGEGFLDLNKEPLQAYSEAKSSAELVALQFEFFDIEVDSMVEGGKELPCSGSFQVECMLKKKPLWRKQRFNYVQ